MTSGPESGEGSKVSFFEQIQDEVLRKRLAEHISRDIFYSGLDLGDSFDVALERALSLAITYKDYFDDVASTGVLSEGQSEEVWLQTVAEMDAGELSKSEPGNKRKKMAGLILRQEIRTKNHVIPVSFGRGRESTSGERH